MMWEVAGGIIIAYIVIIQTPKIYQNWKYKRLLKMGEQMKAIIMKDALEKAKKTDQNSN